MEEDDGAVNFSGQTLDHLRQASAFLDYEADLLDRHAFREWLALWDRNGRYILPIERGETDFENSLNHIYDDHTMRSQRIERLLSGHAPSATPVMRTVRSVSRVRLLGAEHGRLLVSSSLLIVSYKRQVQKLLAADVTHLLALLPDSIRIDEKIVRLIDSDEPLPELSFLP
ncbi:MAG: aromatic-ring-hydroxylating dioxygenase subunit beta [Sphingomonadales bacterium]